MAPRSVAVVHFETSGRTIDLVGGQDRSEEGVIKGMGGSRTVLSTISQPADGTAETSEPALAKLYVVGAPKGFYVDVVKPTFDRVVGTLCLLVAMPAMVACAIAV